MSRRAVTCLLAGCLALAIFPASAASPGLSLVKTGDLREWLTYIASDELEGRPTFGAGLGLAAAYIEDHLREWGVRPAGDNGSYLQTVKVLGVKTTSRSSVTVRVGNETRTFKDGDGVVFPKFAGGKRTVTVDRVEFAGYGLDVPSLDHTDLRGKDFTNAAVVWLGTNGPRGFDRQANRALTAYRDRYVTEGLKATAIVGPESPARQASPPASSPSATSATGAAAATGPAAPSASGGPVERPFPDFTTTRRLDLPRAPAVTAGDAFYTFLFSQAPTKYDELKRRADAQDSLPSFRLNGVTITFTIDADYDVVRTQLTHNVVGIVDGSDPALASTYVAFGAHYDHVGYSEAVIAQNGTRPPPPSGRTGTAPADDIIWNGADDDGSGTVALMGIARAFAQGPRPRRSLLFVWHAGEELGTYGSLYFADHPSVPLDAIVAQLNIDMIGRNRNDDASEENTVYLVGSDRISSELDQVSRAANASLSPPLRLNYEMNAPSDPEQIYYRSDHYSYASKGIPIVFFTTGLHADYHTSGDEVSKIHFEKMTRIAGLVYETGERLADLDHPPVRDNKGPRAVKGTP